jgi:hypothetical protein
MLWGGNYFYNVLKNQKAVTERIWSDREDMEFPPDDGVPENGNALLRGVIPVA